MLSMVLQSLLDTLYHEEKAFGCLYLVQPDIMPVSSQTSRACAQDA